MRLLILHVQQPELNAHAVLLILMKLESDEMYNDWDNGCQMPKIHAYYKCCLERETACVFHPLKCITSAHFTYTSSEDPHFIITYSAFLEVCAWPWNTAFNTPRMVHKPLSCASWAVDEPNVITRPHFYQFTQSNIFLV